MPPEIVPTPFQQLVLDRLDAAVTLGLFGLALLIFLASAATVRHL